MHKEHFHGKVISVEPDGFGMVEFEKEIGAAKHGFFNPKTINVGKLHATLKLGTKIEGDVVLTKGTVLEVFKLNLNSDEFETMVELGSL